MSTVRTGPQIGLIVQIVLLAGLATTVGLGVAGWLAGLAYGAVTCLALVRGLRHAGSDRLGPADWVTMGRGLLVGGVTALIADALIGGRPAPVAVLVAMTTVALALDAVDGKVARRTKTVSALGARFDMEVDSFLVLMLSLYVAPSVGVWVLAIGVMRYAFLAASWALPWMDLQLPPRYWRKVVAAVQGIMLAVAASQVLPGLVTTIVLVTALGLLVESFGRDVTWLWRQRTTTVRPVPALLVPTVPIGVRRVERAEDRDLSTAPVLSLR
ncbi:Phosphatidylglycerophosphate synthase [Micromonospora phaseoli]|uniref:Phosphatidylglycerophosphate synthase n=1 Tax=Micromonospora phaseoli TaxID=1144548 RepID=A0A1H6U8K0_9ACTN|nr:phosphatidylglycerophosphate synthase [Micromonospora phaseoli]GIJ76327.1 membrane protein [Micromonospora phaseoli]SEI88698.1 Phosphatidylglycerophosphate synthase [Micromonospora phaseoli]